MDYIKELQLEIMLGLSCICGTLAFLIALTKTLPAKRKRAFLLIELDATLLLVFDRYAYIYNDDISRKGYIMVRVCNFMVFFLSLFVIYSFGLFLKDLLMNECRLKKAPVGIRIADVLIILGEVLVIFSQFSGFYYTIDEFNRYHRGKGIALNFLIGISAMFALFIVIVQNVKRFSKRMRISLLIFAAMPITASVVQLFAYGVSLTNMTVVGVAMLLYIFALFDTNDKVTKADQHEIALLKEEQKNMQLMFEQTASALASAIDAKDRYTHGHSRRVAEYSEKLARLSGKKQHECEEVYFAALLHDVGKIGIPDYIINKVGKLTDEEFAAIKSHPAIGKQILSSISRSPFLSIGAGYHHERYDGKGYPEGLKGDDIPEIARIIAVADAYDAMTSKRSYRDPLPQPLVREEIAKGIETQFDPVYARIMLRMIDDDPDYVMREHDEVKELSGRYELYCGDYRSDCSEGILLTRSLVKINLNSKAEEGFLAPDSIPVLLIFDSLDARVHYKDGKRREMYYTEYGEIRLDGVTRCTGARKMRSKTLNKRYEDTDELLPLYQKGVEYYIEAVKYGDHILIKIITEFQHVEVITALPDSARYAYLGLTGKHCRISNVEISKPGKTADENTIPRIAEEVSYIKAPEGDIPNVQINAWRIAATKSIPLVSHLKLSFRAMSLPTARLIWHCPYISIFYSEDQKINGPDYTEYALIRFDGETKVGNNTIEVNKTADFISWDAWKERLKKGIDCTADIVRKGGLGKGQTTVVTTIEAGGLSIKNTTTITEDIFELFVSVTGDQVAITGIKIEQ